ncbi:MAG: hypothetical protein KAW88_07560, partial [Candidatus Cloacimonetes bacterium]|nr:hypothetical protein [Candidatus Cloacimonadota bacterium]
MKNIKLTILILFIISFSFADTTIPGEFTFSDSIGSFEYYLPAGVYDIYTKRLFYEDAIFYNVEVIEGEYTLIFIPLTEMVKMEDHEISNSPFL